MRLKNDFVWTKNRGFMTWAPGFKLFFLSLLSILFLILGVIGYVYYSFPELYAYTIVWAFVKIYQRKLFLFYDEAYHTERQWRIIQIELTAEDRRESKEFVDLFIERRNATIPFKRQVYLLAKAARNQQFSKIYRILLSLEQLGAKRDAAYKHYRELSLAVKGGNDALNFEIEELYQRDDKQYFEADIENPRNTVLRIIDRQLEQIQAAYADVLIEKYCDPNEVRRYKARKAARLLRERVIEEALLDYYRQRYRDVYKIALKNKRWWQSLEHLIKPSGWPEKAGDDADEEDEHVCECCGQKKVRNP